MNPNIHGGGERAPESFESPQENYQGYETGTAEKEEGRPEARPSTPETNRSPSQPAIALPPASPPAAPVDDTAVAPLATADDVTPSNGGDKIEKQWIEKAKSIITQTKEDPHAQKQEMSRVKAQYIQKRFNKTIKVDSQAL